MQLIRLTDADDPRFTEAMAAYAVSFPAHEQRESASQAAIMADGDYHFFVLNENNRDVGALLCWETDAFAYVEHFFVYPNERGHGFGSAALQALALRGRPIVLEIDPPVDAVALRRKAFYERCGFAENPFAHVHPPYHRGNAGHSLRVMSAPRALSPQEYAAFARYLGERVMGRACVHAARGSE